MSARQEVWITGMGVLSAAGTGIEPLRQLLRRGKAAPGSAEGFPAPDPPRTPANRRLDRSGRFFLAAAEEAWSGAGLDATCAAGDRVLLLEGSSLGPMADLLRAQEKQLTRGAGHPRTPGRLVRFMTGAGGALFAQQHGIRGMVMHLSAGSVSAACAVGEACQRINRGQAELALAGGAECPLHPAILDTFRESGVLIPQGKQCRPFDQTRCGTVLGEGAGVLVLESSAHARRRGATPLARVTGFGCSTEAYSVTAPDPQGSGVTRAAEAALRLSPLPVWIKCHGTGTRLNDAAECRGLAALLQSRLPECPITSLKSTLGHALGASGAVEAVAALLALMEGMIPATVATEYPDPDLGPCRVVTHPEPAASGPVLLLSQSFGGRSVALTIAPP